MSKKFMVHINRKDLVIILGLITITSVAQIIVGRKIFEMGFFTDDWLFLSLYRTYVANPFLDILQAWKGIGSHNFSYSYYIGVLHNFFGLDYLSYRITNQVIKIIATLSVYPLILYISKRKLLAFLSTFLFAIHFSSFGLLDGPSRGGNYLALTLMNIFLLAYLYVLRKKISNIFVSLGLSVGLIAIVLAGSTRLFPLVILVPLIEILYFIKSKKGVKLATLRLFIIYSPFLLLYFFSPSSIGGQLGYFGGLFAKLKLGNWQLFLTPFAAMGSMYIPRDFWQWFGNPAYNNLGLYLTDLLFQSLIVYFILLIPIIFFISKKPLKFIARNLILNFIIGIAVYWTNHNWLYLDTTTRAPVDPGTFLMPSLIGLFIVTTSFCSFWEWKESEKKNELLPYLFLAPVFSLLFIFLTWLFADINSIFMGVHAYLTIPSIGTSIVFATILALIYERLRPAHKIIPVALIIVILFSYFILSAKIVDQFYSNWVNNGLRVSDQQRLFNQFWTEIGESKQFNQNNLPLIYLDTEKTKYEDGSFYAEAIVWKISFWLDYKYRRYGEGYFPLCAVEILGKTEFDKFVTRGEDSKTIVSNKCGRIEYKLENFYAFRLEDRNLIPERSQILKNLGFE